MHTTPRAASQAAELPDRQDAAYGSEKLRTSCYLAGLFGSNDTEAMVRLIIALLVLVFDPLAVWLTIAASQAKEAKRGHH